MSNYLEWLLSEPDDVQQEILRNNPPTESFKDFGDVEGISLEDLEKLDDKYIL